MKYNKIETVNIVAKIFCDAVKEVIDNSTGSTVTYAPTIQNVPSISLKPDVGCFVQFSGDYSGLFIMNLSNRAALEIYRKSMIYMGLPKEELAADYYSDEVVNSIGELINQIIGKARQKIEQQYGLSASNNQPKAITISSAITLSVATMLDKPKCRRLSFRTEQNNPFYVEMNLEQTEFIPLKQTEQKEPSSIQDQVDEVIKNGSPETNSTQKSQKETTDVDDIMAEFGL